MKLLTLLIASFCLFSCVSQEPESAKGIKELIDVTAQSKEPAQVKRIPFRVTAPMPLSN